MADNHTKEVRSFNMSRIRAKDTKPEVLVRSYLFSKGLRFRKNDKRYPGRPDIVLPKYKTIIFINGCFWHVHEGCSDFVMPKSNIEYWTKKLESNRIRDQNIRAQLESQGWQVIVVWECELKPSLRQNTLGSLFDRIISMKVGDAYKKGVRL